VSAIVRAHQGPQSNSRKKFSTRFAKIEEKYKKSVSKDPKTSKAANRAKRLMGRNASIDAIDEERASGFSLIFPRENEI